MQHSEPDPLLALSERLAHKEVSPDQAADALQQLRQEAQEILWRHYGRGTRPRPQESTTETPRSEGGPSCRSY